MSTIAPSVHVTALKGFCQSGVAFQWKGQIFQAVFLFHCRNSSIAILLSSLFSDQKASLGMGTYLLNG